MDVNPAGSQVAKSSLKPRGRQLRPPPPTREKPARGYDGAGQVIARVDRVTPALVYGTSVSVDHASDHWNLLLQVTTVGGGVLYLLVSKRGWVPAVPRPAAAPEMDGYGRTLAFQFTTKVPAELDRVQLSYADRKRITAGILAEFVGAPDWERLERAAQINS